jgi:hypothetical protein
MSPILVWILRLEWIGRTACNREGCISLHGQEVGDATYAKWGNGLTVRHRLVDTGLYSS